MPRRASVLATAALGAALLSSGCGAFGSRVAADDHYRRALGLAQQGKLAPALEAIDQALAGSPSDAGVLLTRADILLLTGRVDEARRDLERARRLQPDQPAVILACAMERASSGDLEDGLAVLEEALARDVVGEEIRWLAGVLRLQLGRHEAAEAGFLALLERAEVTGSTFRVAARLGLALARAPASLDAGAEAFAAAARCDTLACLAVMEDLAREELDQPLCLAAARAAELQPEDLAVGLAFAGLLEIARRCDEAVAEVDRLLALRPERTTEVRLWLVAAAADAQRVRFAGAREKIRHALDLDPACLEGIILLQRAVIEGKGGPEDLADLRRRIAAARETVRGSEELRFLDHLERSLP